MLGPQSIIGIVMDEVLYRLIRVPLTPLSLDGSRESSRPLLTLFFGHPLLRYQILRLLCAHAHGDDGERSTPLFQYAVI